ncbi:Uncharacterized conserved protein, DUF305 family [Kaistella treverensis]|uniref:Uncharacterized conserved protein, DUF305 family n=1 Tax=Kaistella treverensis TaxID=631455 RepID=A0A1I3JKD4_9FLAO|nr:DUF305 domain-containing protein [Kaistella treverensis]SFI60634.1 Uncharacterized conserved protein, DUF305 family [Kaistella treverensis]
MKKTLLAFSISFLLFSCSETEKISPDSGKISENSEKNEMVALMDEMMDDMHSGKPTGNIDADFANMMIAHHQGAVDMSQLLLEKGTDPELKKFAQKVIADQNTEIALMKKYAAKAANFPENKEFEQALNQSMAAMMNSDTKVYNDIDKDYAAQMIPHHQSAVDMAKVYQKFGKEKELLNLSDRIVRHQTSEIAQLQAWLDKN